MISSKEGIEPKSKVFQQWHISNRVTAETELQCYVKYLRLQREEVDVQKLLDIVAMMKRMGLRAELIQEA